MEEPIVTGLPEHTQRYRCVMACAEGIASARARPTSSKAALVTVRNVFAALCKVHPEAFGQLLGMPVPVPNAAAEAKVAGDPVLCRYSAGVDRYLSPYGGIVAEMLKEVPADVPALDSLHIAAALLWEPIPETENMLSVCGFPPGKVRSTLLRNLRLDAERETGERRKAEQATAFRNIGRIREYLLARCFGQDDAVETIVTQLSIAWGMPPAERGSKPLSFFFAGAPGTGKNHVTDVLRDAFEEILGIQKIPVVDFARFAAEQMALDLVGRDTAWKDGGHEGVFPQAVRHNPFGILVVENYERGHACAVSHLDTLLETGRMEDGYTKETVSFAHNIVIIITHQKEFAESEELSSLTAKTGGGTLPRDKIIEGLVKFAPGFHSTLRLVDAPILFKQHTCKSFLSIVRSKVAAMKRRFTEAYDADCDFDGETLEQILVDMHPSVASGHPVDSSLESTILLPLQKWLMDHLLKFSLLHRRIRIVSDPVPDFEGAPERKDYGDFADWLEARTAKRLSRAKRLVFTTAVETEKDAVVLHFKDIAFSVLPSIEDCGFFSVKAPDVSFADLVGVDLVKDRIREVVDYFNHPGKGGARPETGIVLYGPPGTGKTSVAKAIANELGTPFIMMSGTDFTKCHLGEGVEAVKHLFAAARRYGAVVFIDEIDALGSRNTDDSESARVVNAFLTELDGFRERNLLVIGATNRYEMLDEALVRPGRLSLKIQLGLLHSKADRRRLIAETLARAGTSVPESLLERLVETTNAWSPANLVAMVNGGIRQALREGMPPDFGHFAKARTVVLFGEDPQRTDRAEREIRLTAVHEAGHAAAAALRGIRFVQASVQGVGDASGFVEHLGIQGHSSRKDLCRMIDMTLGGRAAEELLAEPSDGVQSDFARATLLAARLVQLGMESENILAIPGETDKEFILRNREKIDTILHHRMGSVQKLLARHRPFLEAVAEALSTQKLLFEADVLALRREKEGTVEE